MKKMKYKLTIVFLFFSLHSSLSAQVTFHSAEFEAGVKRHLRLTNQDSITIAQMDTITKLDLSGLGLTDIQDIRFLTHLVSVDLSYNNIDDIRPLVSLEMLREINLRNNQLESINMLAFSYAEEMELDVSFNHIKDFSFFSTLTHCQFTIYGANMQTEKDQPYFRVRYLYSDGTETSPSIYCRVDATTVEQAQLIVNNMTYSIATNNQPYVYQLDEDCSDTHQVLVTDGTNTDSTFLVGLKIIEIKPSQIATIKNELPEYYELRFLPAQNVTLSTNGADFSFITSPSFEYEEVLYTFYVGGELKGIAKVILTKDKMTDSINTPNNIDTNFSIVLDNDVLCLRCHSASLAERSFIEICDISGRIFASKNVDSSQGIDERILLPTIPKDIIIIRVNSGNKQFVNKYVVE